MKLQYPLSYVHVNQAFGANADYYLSHFGTKGHMGIDFQAGHFTPVYAAHDGFGFYVGPDSHGGDGVYIRAQDTDGTWYTTIYWHLISKDDPLYAPKVGSPGRDVKAGELIGYADNTGAPFETSGDHLHFGLAYCDVNGTFLNTGNGFGGCVDPQPFLPVLAYTFSNNLWFGQTSEDVRQLQIRLGISPTSGFFGPLTLKAVIQYQRSNGITPTGFVGPITRSKLNQ